MGSMSWMCGYEPLSGSVNIMVDEHTRDSFRGQRDVLVRSVLRRYNYSVGDLSIDGRDLVDV